MCLAGDYNICDKHRAEQRQAGYDLAEHERIAYLIRIDDLETAIHKTTDRLFAIEDHPATPAWVKQIAKELLEILTPFIMEKRVD